jgi:hypothetical protein
MILYIIFKNKNLIFIYINIQNEIEKNKFYILKISQIFLLFLNEFI